MLSALFLAGCISVWKEQRPPWSPSSVAGAQQVWVERLDGTKVTLLEPAMREGGSGPFLTGIVVEKGGLTGAEGSIELADVSRLWALKPSWRASLYWGIASVWLYAGMALIFGLLSHVVFGWP